MQLTATTFFGLEETLADELKALGAKEIQPLNRAVAFEGDQQLLYKANLHLRTALRVLVPIYEFEAGSPEQLYQEVQAVQWQQYMSSEDTLAVDSVVGSEIFTHSQYVALKVKDAIVDRFRMDTGQRPSVDVRNPTLRIHIHITGTACTLSLDSSGNSLHRRGYRLAKNPAPLNEVLAAGMVLISGWDGQHPFLDPMCGSGTILIEAAMVAMHAAPGLMRQFGFMRWRDYDADLWEKVLEEAQLQIRDLNTDMYGLDIDGDTLAMASANLKRARLHRDIKIRQGDFFRFEAPTETGTLMMNPPYDKRMQEEDINAFYQDIGDKLKQTYSGWDAWILSGNREALKHIGLRTSVKHVLYNGPLEARFQKYELYQGRREK